MKLQLSNVRVEKLHGAYFKYEIRGDCFPHGTNLHLATINSYLPFREELAMQIVECLNTHVEKGDMKL